MKNLRFFYDSLPRSTQPKTEFVKKVAHETGVTETTVRNWIKNGTKPNNHEHVIVLERLTGLTEKELFNNE